MPWLLPLLYTLFSWFTRYIVIKAFAILGIGVASYAVIQYLFDKYVNAGLAQLGGISADVAALMGIAKLDHAISIVLGAYSVRGFILAARTMFGALSG